MVPIGSLAFMPGHLIHTNEITVLLGESYFAEQSAVQESGIISRRKEFVQNLIKKAEEEAKKTSAKAHTSDHIRKTLLEDLVGDEHDSEPPDHNSHTEEQEDDEEEGEDEEDEEDEGKVCNHLTFMPLHIAHKTARARVTTFGLAPASLAHGPRM